MKKIVYDFTEAIAELKHGFSPYELAENLRATALRCALETDREKHVLRMQTAVQDVCAFLDAIVEMEVEQ